MTTNKSIGNEIVTNSAINQINNYLLDQNIDNETRNTLISLKIILTNPESKIAYVNIKSLVILYNLLENFDLKLFNKNNIENIIDNLNNEFLENDLDLNIDLESTILKLIDVNNFDINKILVFKYEKLVKSLLLNLSIDKDGKEKSKNNFDEIKIFLEEKIKFQIGVIKNQITSLEVIREISSTKNQISEILQK